MRNALYRIVMTAGILVACHAFAADVQMSLDHQLISLLDRAVLKIEFIDTQGDAVNIPSVDGLNIQYQGKSTETRIVNLKSTTKVVHNYLVTPTKVGDYTIGPVRVKFKGGEKELAAKLRVIKKADDQEAQQISEMMYSRISCSHPSPFVHEPFDLQVKLFIRDGVQIADSFSLTGGLPEQGLDGELEWEVGRRGREEIDGVIYNTYILHTTAKTLTAGTFSFQPGVQINVVVPRQRRRSYGFEDPFFGDFFGRQETRPIVLDCNRLDIDVRPIPVEGRPDSFTGGVGKMDFDVSVGPDKLKAGEPLTVKMRITGTGNLEKIMPPHLNEHQGIKLYDVRSVPSDHPDEVCFEQVVIPTTDSIHELPSISFSYFNTQTADFRTITKGPFPISVEASPQQSARVLTAGAPARPRETEVLGQDIAYLKPAPAQWHRKNATRFYHRRMFQVGMLFPVLLVAVTGLVVMRRSRLEQNVALARRQKAPRAARLNIQQAEQAIKQRDTGRFYEAMWNAITEYFGHRLNLAPGQITLQSVLARIPDENDSIQQLFNTVEQRRYGIRREAADPQEMKNLLKQLVGVLKKCERMKL